MVEMLVVLAVMAVLITLVVPNLAGFHSGGKQKAYVGAKETLQLAVDAWRNGPGKTTGPLYPILQTGDSVEQCIVKLLITGDLVDPAFGSLRDPTCNPYIDIALLADVGFIRNPSAVTSANRALNTTARNDPSGSYGWFVNTGGLVSSVPVFAEGLFP
jgi:type II secretory pathway pseudopilin PulG